MGGLATLCVALGVLYLLVRVVDRVAKRAASKEAKAVWRYLKADGRAVKATVRSAFKRRRWYEERIEDELFRLGRDLDRRGDGHL